MTRILRKICWISKTEFDCELARFTAGYSVIPLSNFFTYIRP